MFQRKLIAGLGVTAVGVFCASTYTRIKVENYFTEQEYYKRAVQVFMKHQPSIDILGPPVTCRRINLSDINNKMNNVKVTFVIPVSGKKSYGKLFVDASRESPEQVWGINEIKLCLNSKPDKYLSVCKLENCNLK